MTDRTSSSPPPGATPPACCPSWAGLLDPWTAEHRDGRGDEWIPVARQAEYQSRVVLAAFEPGRVATRPLLPFG
ncbi:hypothetical protein [Streptomyces glaucescens]|uniref:hypothetical protein n=1 Tax=Streptomyces glaucescens TaxID=1907 RepID=UPI003BB7FB89